MEPGRAPTDNEHVWQPDRGALSMSPSQVRQAITDIEQRDAICEVVGKLRAGRRPATEELRLAEEALTDAESLQLLSSRLLPSEDLELLITALRGEWLRMVSSPSRANLPSVGLLMAVALQMEMTEWVYGISDREKGRLEKLEHQLSAQTIGGFPTQPGRLVYAMYKPLEVSMVEDEQGRSPPGTDGLWREIVRRHLDEPAEERSIAAALPVLTTITDPVSQVVRTQYERRPYPRWREAPVAEPRPLAEVVSSAIGRPGLATVIDIESPEVLIAGCGTGRHAVLSAARYSGAKVLGVDLSKTALAYATRQSLALGLDIEYAQADILGLGRVRRSFDVIESVGVLHHIASPERAVGVLAGLLRPGGLMKLGLYSRLGRAMLDPISEMIASQGLRPTSEGIRRTRALIRSLPEGNPARRLANTPDFYSLGGCRDLFYPAHEDRFDLQRISRMLQSVGLHFLGFELSSHARNFYLSRFPDDVDGISLGNWDRIERDNPFLFTGMYRFWAGSQE